MRIRQDCTRGRISKADKDKLIKRAEDIIFNATTTTDISLNELENRLKSINLCKECNVVRKANPVGKPKKKSAAEVKL